MPSTTITCDFRTHRNLVGPLEFLHTQAFSQRCSEDLHCLCRTLSAPATQTPHLQVVSFLKTTCHIIKLKHLNQSLILESIFSVSSLPHLAATSTHFLGQIVQVLSNGDQVAIALPAAQPMDHFLLIHEVHPLGTAAQAQDSDLVLPPLTSDPHALVLSMCLSATRDQTCPLAVTFGHRVVTSSQHFPLNLPFTLKYQ